MSVCIVIFKIQYTGFNIQNRSKWYMKNDKWYMSTPYILLTGAKTSS